MKMVLRLIAGALATAAAVWLVPGVRITADSDQQYVLTLLVVAGLLGVVNAVVRPITTLVSCCLVVLTLGLFLLVINAAMLTLTAWLGQQFGLPFHVDDFWSALLGGLVISVVSSVTTGLLDVERE
ncbi:MAG: phage holin family protein [Propionibacteriaceae bacterium]|nr:phage holin family protein [Propionibacteriaceae bacterium]